ncbi:MAG: DUF2207 domain-containing protein [Propionibacteriaceae bacterium]|nr:DUF2207 domain-containing protein [Propionibacteriaceae bacterium]
MWTTALRRLACALLLTLALLTIGAPGAHASTDVVRSLDTTYTIQPDGRVQVRQEFEWVFGQPGRRGIQLALATRERWSLTHDVVYGITDVEVSSPTGAPDAVTSRSHDEGRSTWLNVRVGDGTPVEGLEHTYVLTYELSGALRTFDGVPELHWDVTSEAFPPVEQATTRVVAPGGVQRVRCLVGPRECTAQVVDGAATFGATTGAGEVLTVVAALQPDAVRDAEPRLVATLGFVRALEYGAGVGAGVLTLLATWIVLKQTPGSDERFADTPPGIVNDPDAPIRKAARATDAPVRFSPPDGLDPATAGALLACRYEPEQVAATVVELAASGAATVTTDPLRITASGPRPAHDRLAATFHQLAGTNNDDPLPDLVEAAGEHAVATLSDPTHGVKVLSPNVTVNAVVVAVIAAGAWWVLREYVIDPLTSLQYWVIMGMLAGLALAIAGTNVRGRVVNHRLSATGTARRDQVLGFRRYLATAEADQLDFEADADIYRRYLPWAVLFGLTERWVRVCRELAAAGRLGPVTAVLGSDVSAGSDVSDDLTDTLAGLAFVTASVRQASRSYRPKPVTVAMTEPPSSSGSSGSGGSASGGGSGTSSGFSSSSGGSGGGGTRASSW